MSRHHVFIIIFCSAVVAAVILFMIADHVVEFKTEVVVEKVAETVQKVVSPNTDIEPQQPLVNPPQIIKAMYATGYSAGNSVKVAYFMNLLNATELNAIVIDVKDYTGYVSYEPNVDEVKKYNAWENKIPRMNALIKKLHDAGVYVIARIAVFQDSKLVLARPDLALHASSTGEVWRDYKKVAWLDTAATPVWDYNLAIAKDALSRGFDEVNFDYIRFASDGNLKDITYPYFDEKTLKHTTLKKFFTYVHEQLPDAKVSADLFGLVTEDIGDMGIGQHLEDAFPSFNFVAPMTYPSHYASGYRGFPNPATHPYEVIKFAMDSALARLTTYNKQVATYNEQQAALAASSTVSSSSEKLPATSYKLSARAQFRPWVQDFDLGADYTPALVRAQIQAIYDAGCTSSLPNASSTEQFATRLAPCDSNIQGWMLWNPSNVYTKEALLPEE